MSYRRQNPTQPSTRAQFHPHQHQHQRRHQNPTWLSAMQCLLHIHRHRNPTWLSATQHTSNLRRHRLRNLTKPSAIRHLILHRHRNLTQPSATRCLLHHLHQNLKWLLPMQYPLLHLQNLTRPLARRQLPRQCHPRQKWQANHSLISHLYKPKGASVVAMKKPIRHRCQCRRRRGP